MDATAFYFRKLYQINIRISPLKTLQMKLFTKEPQTETGTPPKKKSVVREWTDALVFAVVAATFIRWIFLEAYTIPTPSMEKSLLVGDFLFVSKFHYGARTAKTPLQVPLTHQKIWGTEIPSYLDWIQLPQFRLPGFIHIKNNDVVVFNYPADYQYPVDLKTNYIKRCIGIAGDTLEVRKHIAYINGKPAEMPAKMQHSYRFRPTEYLNERFFEKLNITDDIYQYHKDPSFIIINGTEETAAKLKEMPFIKDLVLNEDPPGEADTQVYPHSSTLNWNKDNYGPLYIPKEGFVMDMNPDNVLKYAFMIEKYEEAGKVESRDGKLIIDGKAVDKYTWKQNYYFMMGDNRHNSLDSRFWGFVPEDHVVGKAFLVWMSIDPKGSFSTKIRWNRLFNLIN